MALEAEEMELPDFLKNSSEDEIHEKMLGNLPEDIDKSEGGFPWDFTRPTAIEISELKEYVLVEVLKSMFPVKNLIFWIFIPRREGLYEENL